MLLRDIEREFFDSVIMKHSFQNNTVIETNLTILLDFSIVCKYGVYLCDYSFFINEYSHETLPPYTTFFIVNSDSSCLNQILPSDITYFFLRIDFEEFYSRLKQLISSNNYILKKSKLLTMQRTWKEALNGQTIDYTKTFYPFDEFIACILIESNDEPPLSGSELLHLLCLFSDFFQEQNTFPYKGSIVILYSQSTRPTSELDFSYISFNKLLIEYKLKASISNACRYKEMYPTLYRTTSAVLKFSKALSSSQKYSHILQYNEYSMYYIIDLCAKEFIRTHHHNDIIYLISPSVIELYRYDQNHQCDLLNTLFHYLLQGGNVADTATVLFMHRNTVLNKLNKINSIIHLPLDNGSVKFTLLMSCFIVNYYEKYLKEKL